MTLNDIWVPQEANPALLKECCRQLDLTLVHPHCLPEPVLTFILETMVSEFKKDMLTDDPLRSAIRRIVQQLSLQFAEASEPDKSFYLSAAPAIWFSPVVEEFYDPSAPVKMTLIMKGSWK